MGAGYPFSLLLVGLGMGLFSSPNTSATMGAVPRTHLGVAAGMLGTMRTVGQSLGVTMSSAVVTFYVGSREFLNRFDTVDEKTPNQFLTGINAALLVSASVTFVALVTALVRGSEKRERQPA